MKIGINLVGVSYNDGAVGRYRNFEDATDGFFKHLVSPLVNQGHTVQYYVCTYDSPKREQLLTTYSPVIKSQFLDEGYTRLGGGDRVDGMKIMSAIYVYSLNALLGEDLDVVISTRFDISFQKNPFETYEYDFSKCNFLWREPEFTHVPIVSDTFIVFPHRMTENMIASIMRMETNPPHGVGHGMHNLYVPMCDEVGRENVKIVCDEYQRSDKNDLYKLTRYA